VTYGVVGFMTVSSLMVGALGHDGICCVNLVVRTGSIGSRRLEINRVL